MKKTLNFILNSSKEKEGAVQHQQKFVNLIKFKKKTNKRKALILLNVNSLTRSALPLNRHQINQRNQPPNIQLEANAVCLPSLQIGLKDQHVGKKNKNSNRPL